MAGALAKVAAAKAWPGISLALQFKVLTAARAAEVRKATWREFSGFETTDFALVVVTGPVSLRVGESRVWDFRGS